MEQSPHVTGLVVTMIGTAVVGALLTFYGQW
jgi:hypothetical protein